MGKRLKAFGIWFTALALIVTFGVVYSQVSVQYLSRISFSTSAVAAGNGQPLIGSGVTWHQLTWNALGTVSGCTVAVDSSADGVSWTPGGVIAGQTCTSNGQSTAVNAN